MDIHTINKIKDLLGDDIGVYHDTDNDLWEIIQYDTDKHGTFVLDGPELKELNRMGLLFTDQAYDIDYDDEAENGELEEKYMDIAYFKYIKL